MKTNSRIFVVAGLSVALALLIIAAFSMRAHGAPADVAQAHVALAVDCSVSSSGLHRASSRWYG